MYFWAMHQIKKGTNALILSPKKLILVWMCLSSKLNHTFLKINLQGEHIEKEDNFLNSNVEEDNSLKLYDPHPTMIGAPLHSDKQLKDINVPNVMVE